MGFRKSESTRVLLIGGSPCPMTPARVAELRSRCDVVVAVDRGYDTALRADTGCDLFCGDLDSISARGATLLRAAEAHSTAADPMLVERYDPHKDFTDLAGALRAIDARWPDASIIATCCFGGSPDHLLGVLGRLKSRGGHIELVEDAFCGRILHGGDRWRLRCATEQRFSFIPISDCATVSLSGMRWKLDRSRVGLLSDLGISNVIECDDASIICHDGSLIAWAFSPETARGSSACMHAGPA
ncbi:thiamine pyrophosphokinase [Coriobacterium glomerans PW2]|uniref:Thiamine diphosphokinase n=1 Tax=Coriobacterium glomerans (strain ATCC 49209 / DSM 20642 / JCM 10262 / PW2) TaxID=700015 RepID=F2N9S3_CORGP|nr:thiamine diphosphokinase [Coriobacterium glomerans]AEB07176.1 thiamine pyrophosphokinase [Coriobacterium glomerans PW2]